MIHAIDPWGRINESTETRYSPKEVLDDGDGTQRLFEERMRPYDNVKMIKGFSLSVSEKFEDESLDLVYIDGDHGRISVKNDALAWWPKVKYGGVLSGHDYGFHGVKKGLQLWSEETGIPIPRQPRGGLGYKDRTWRIVKI